MVIGIRKACSKVAIALLPLACVNGGPSGGSATPPPARDVVPATTQRAGDPDAGYVALVNNGYVSCGIPYSLYARFAGPAPASMRLPGRTGRNATLPYNMTAFTTKAGVEVVSANCLTCHAGHIKGRLVVGLGAADGDFTDNYGAAANLAGAAEGFLDTDAEKAELRKWAARTKAIAPYVQTSTVGVNPADNLAAVLFAHRDVATLAWSDTPILELPPEIVVPVDVPPWWRMRKKNAMFYNAAGRGDHARIMMTASTLCTDSVEQATEIDAYFNDIRAFIASLTPPPYPYAVEGARAEIGRRVFEGNCASCHGTYGPDGEYPNRVVPIETIGTDPALVVGSTQFADLYIAWFNASFYGRTARLEPERGYVAPPLDGIWATAPYLHNGSVPTVAALLESRTRPRFWTRTFNSNDYDPIAVGWRFTEVDGGKANEPDAEKKKYIYDTTELGYSNAGHTFGDALTTDERAAVIEYLKTL
ncbi:MAG: c-type cytochrome [Deltaproteobacteria bacterium]|nr:c-type cytochrome [Deltaproteobacteria bacterium]